MQGSVPQGLYCWEQMSKVYTDKKNTICKNKNCSCSGVWFTMVVVNKQGFH